MDSLTSTKLPHVHQSHGWDCGLACIRMALRHLILDEDLIRSYMKEIDLDTSVWTVDLAYILSRYGLKSDLYTTSLQVQDEYVHLPYYKSQFERDKERVEKLFNMSKDHKYTCVQRHLEIDEIASMLPMDTVVVSLIDWRLMDCRECSSKVLHKCSKICSKLLCSQSYQGHFVVVTSIDPAQNLVVYQDPGLRSGPCYTSLEVFDKARMANGTDEDLLFISLSQ